MIATIAVIAEKKKFSYRSDHSDHMKPLSSDRSESGFHMIAELFFLSDRSDHMETGLNLSQ